MKCILHIGTEKTGTTLIQNWLYKNRLVLSKHRIYLSDIIGKPNNRLFSAFYTVGLDDWAFKNNIKSHSEKDLFFKNFLCDLSSEIKTAALSHDIFIITSEHLHSRVRDPSRVQKIKEFLNEHFEKVEVICYFRNQYDMAVSLYTTALNLYTCESLNEFIKNAIPQNYYYSHIQVADLWSDVFGMENCNFRIYDRNNFISGDIRSDFLKIISQKLNLKDLDSNNFQANESLHLLQAAVLRALNRTLLNNDSIDLKKLTSSLKRKIGKVESLKKGRHDFSNRHSVEQLFDESNQLFFRKYFNSNNLFKSIISKNATKRERIAINDVEVMIEEVVNICLQSTLEYLTTSKK